MPRKKKADSCVDELFDELLAQNSSPEANLRESGLLKQLKSTINRKSSGGRELSHHLSTVASIQAPEASFVEQYP